MLADIQVRVTETEKKLSCATLFVTQKEECDEKIRLREMGFVAIPSLLFELLLFGHCFDNKHQFSVGKATGPSKYVLFTIFFSVLNII